MIADTKWECVALLCGDSGIPDTVEERMEIFGQIMEKAKEYNIAPSRLHIDPLVISLGTNSEFFTTFAEVTRQVKAQYPDIHVTSGLSNISFGLPSRKTINQAFLILAMYAGMDSAIMDPTNRDMLGSLYTTEAKIPALMIEKAWKFIGRTALGYTKKNWICVCCAEASAPMRTMDCWRSLPGCL